MIYAFQQDLWCAWRSSSPKVFCKKRVLRNFAKFTGKHLYQSLFLNKVAGWGTFLHLFWRKSFLTEHLGWLLLCMMYALLTGKVEKFARFLACWHAKLKNWHIKMTLLARGDVDHAGTHGTQFSKLLCMS